LEYLGIIHGPVVISFTDAIIFGIGDQCDQVIETQPEEMARELARPGLQTRLQVV